MHRLQTVLIATIALIAALPAAAGGRGEGPLVSTDTDSAIWISPAVVDGRNDALTVPFDVALARRIVASGYTLAVSGDGGTIYEESTTSRRPRLLGRLIGAARRGGIAVPEIVVWDGRDDNGELVPDGRYELTFAVTDRRGREGISDPVAIVVDNTPPNATVSVPFLTFSPDGDGRRDVLAFEQTGSRETEWSGAITANDTVIIARSWVDDAPGSFVWDGSDDTGSPPADGLYDYLLTSTDRAGNRFTTTVDRILINTSREEVTVGLSRGSFSPNGDGVNDELEITPLLQTRQGLVSWQLEILTTGRRPVRSFAGEQLAGVVWDGSDGEGRRVADGEYLVELAVEFENGSNPATAAIVRVDTITPSGRLVAQPSLFSPDGDGNRDTTTLRHLDTSMEDLWIGTLTDDVGRRLAEWRWNGRPEDLVFDGRDADGRLLPDGRYRYRIAALDDAGNRYESDEVGFRIDSRPTPITMTAQAIGLSPNSDDRFDTLPLSIRARVTDEVELWTLAAAPGTGGSASSAAGGSTIASGSGRLPIAYDWDGAVRRPNGSRTVLAEGAYTITLDVTYRKGNRATARTAPVRLDVSPPVVALIVEPTVFTPDDDGIDDTVTLRATASDALPIASWLLTVHDRADSTIQRFEQFGARFNATSWDGSTSFGGPLLASESYALRGEVTDALGNTGFAETALATDVFVRQSDGRLVIQVASIYFLPFSAELDPAQAATSRETIARLADYLRRNPTFRVTVEGHAVQIYWWDPARAVVEQRDTLVPLSRARATTVQRLLIDAGVSAGRLVTDGIGGARPVIPHADLTNRWKNRRVEFVLVRPTGG